MPIITPAHAKLQEVEGAFRLMCEGWGINFDHLLAVCGDDDFTVALGPILADRSVVDAQEKIAFLARLFLLERRSSVELAARSTMAAAALFGKIPPEFVVEFQAEMPNAWPPDEWTPIQK